MSGEREFQARLADFIKRCPDDADSDSPEYRAWRDEFEEFCRASTEEQASRALDLYELHILNHVLNPDDFR
jgi:hypothetical protein